MVEINRDCPISPSFDGLRPPIFTPREHTLSINPNERSIKNNPSPYAINLTHTSDIHTPINNFSFNEQLRLERDIAQQSSIITRDSFTTTYSSLQTMLSQMQLKIAAAFLQETEYLHQREQRLEHEETLLNERTKQLENIRLERKRMEDEFVQIKDRLELAVTQVTKFRTDGAEILRILFSESRQIDEQLSELIAESMASLSRTRSIIESKKHEFLQKSDDIHTELNNRIALIQNTESSITVMLELINILNQLNSEHSQQISIAQTDFIKKHEDYINLSQTINHNWNIKEEMEKIRQLENEKLQAQNELLDQALLLENLKTVLGKAIIS